LGDIDSAHTTNERKIAQKRVSSAVMSVMINMGAEANARTNRSHTAPIAHDAHFGSKRRGSVEEIEAIMYGDSTGPEGTADLSTLRRLQSEQSGILLNDEDGDHSSDSSGNEDDDLEEVNDENLNDSSVLLPSVESVGDHLERQKSRLKSRRASVAVFRERGDRKSARKSQRDSVANIHSIVLYLQSNLTDTISIHDMDFSIEDFENIIKQLNDEKNMNHITNIDFKGCKFDAKNISILFSTLTKVA